MWCDDLQAAPSFAVELLDYYQHTGIAENAGSCQVLYMGNDSLTIKDTGREASIVEGVATFPAFQVAGMSVMMGISNHRYRLQVLLLVCSSSSFAGMTP